MSFFRKLIDCMRKEPEPPAPVHSYVMKIFSVSDVLIASCPLKVVESDPEWSSVTLKSSSDGEATRTARAQYCVLKRDGAPVGFMLASELLSTCDLEHGDLIQVHELRVQFGTTATRTLP